MARRRLTTRRNYGRGWARLSRDAIAAHVAVFGWTCPGWGVATHAARDLTADHIVPVALGGVSAPGNLRVLCRSCNSARGARTIEPVTA